MEVNVNTRTLQTAMIEHLNNTISTKQPSQCVGRCYFISV